jgi:histone deacetylase 6
MGDGDYMFAFQQVVMPIAYEFDPDLVIGMLSFAMVKHADQP